MALQPVIQLSNSGDCSVLYLQDITGVYDATLNPGGYGSPNLALSAVTGVTVSLIYQAPDGSPPVSYTAVSVFPTLANPSPFILNEVFNLTPAMFGLSTPTWPDGIYTAGYNVNNFYTATSLPYLMDCTSWCCVINGMSSIDPCDCGCDEKTGQKSVFYYRDLILASEAACGCQKIGEALNLLNIVSKWCSQQNCGCK